MEEQLNLFDEDLTPLEKVMIESSGNVMITNKKSLRLYQNINNTSHNMLIHGFLRCIQIYVTHFGLESTAAMVIRDSGIFKDDLLRCQLETGWENEKMIEIINKAFLPAPVKEIDTMPGNTKEERLRALFSKHFQISRRNNFFKR